MTLAVLAAISEAGRPGRPNEDGWGVAGPFAWVIDGATGLAEEALLAHGAAPGSDAAWLTAALGAALAAGAPAAGTPQALLASAAREVAARFVAERRRPPRERYEMPTAAVLLARFGDAGVEIAEMGDCGLWLSGDETDDGAGGAVRYGGTPQGRALERENARRYALSGGPAVDGARDASVLDFLRRVRNRANRPGGYVVFAPEPDCAALARLHRHRARAGEALFVSDGYEAAIDYGLYTGEGLLAAARCDPAKPLAALRRVEREDAGRTRHPRFKVSDDATALVVRFAGVQADGPNGADNGAGRRSERRS